MKKIIIIALLLNVTLANAKDCSVVVRKAITGVATAAGSVFGKNPNCIAVTEQDIRNFKIVDLKNETDNDVYFVKATLPVSCGTTWEVSVYKNSCFVEKVEATYVE